MSLRSGANFSVMAPGKSSDAYHLSQDCVAEQRELMAQGMFARRAVAQSLAREFGPQGIHVAHVVVDGLIDTPSMRDRAGKDKDEQASHLTEAGLMSRC